MVTIIQDNNPGVAGSEIEDFRHTALITGNMERPTVAMVVDAAEIATADLPIYSVVKRLGNGKIGLAELGDIPVGITCSPVPQGTDDDSIPVFRGGMFNPARLNFHPSFITDAQKDASFDGIEMILLKRVLYENAY